MGLFAQNGRVLVANYSFTEAAGVERIFHTPSYYAGNPVLKADKEWELNVNGDPYAAPFSGGVWYDELAGKYKMWYSAGGKKVNGLITCYAESEDGKQWIKPMLDVVPETNIVDTTEHDCVSVLLDKFESDVNKRYKMFIVEFNTRSSVSMKLKYSADGIHWSEPKALSGELYDRCAAYYDSFRKKYVLSLKTINGKKYRRSRCYLSHEDPEMLVSLAHRVYDNKSDKFIKYWFNAEDDDPHNPQFPDIRPQIYNHEAMPYESSLIGYFTVWQGPENDACDSLMIQKRNEVLIGWSDDGFHWKREFKQPFLPVSSDFNAWNAGNVQSTAGNPLIVGDSLYFYVSGRYNSKPKHDSNFATGLALLRRDGFVSAHAGKSGGHLITDDILVNGKYLFVNADVSRKKGRLVVEILDADGNPISEYTKDDCITLQKKDGTKQMISWKNQDSLLDLSGRKVRLKFYLSEADLYSFWLSSWITGESGGYTSGGGPGLHPAGIDLKTVLNLSFNSVYHNLYHCHLRASKKIDSEYTVFVSE